MFSNVVRTVLLYGIVHHSFKITVGFSRPQISRYLAMYSE